MAASSSPTNEFINSRSEEFINYLFLTDFFRVFRIAENLPLYCIPLNHLLLVFSSAINATPRNALWIGAKKVDDSTWTWTDGSTWNPSWNYWGNTTRPGLPGIVFIQPDGYGNCAHMWTYRTTPNGGWNDLYCNTYIYSTYYVCEMDSHSCCYPLPDPMNPPRRNP